MKTKTIRLETVDSTNRYISDLDSHNNEEMVIVTSSYQTAGRGQGDNKWESEQGKNLLFSILIHPTMVPVHKQFVLSMAYALAVKDALSRYVDDITLKWPNDVYWQNRKISGTLIETAIDKSGIKKCIFGTGVNINQRNFISDAPNPVSLFQIIGHDEDMDKILDEIVKAFINYYEKIREGAYGYISALYHDVLYRRHGFYKYCDAEGSFEAAIVEVEDDGHLILRDREGRMCSYAFKEVTFEDILK